MNKLDQVRGLLRALRNIAMQGIYAEVYKGMEAQCASTYRKCIATLKTISGYEDIESLAPDLGENPSMKEISFAAETVQCLISEGQWPGVHVGVGARPFRMPRMPRMPHMRMHMRGHGPRPVVVDIHRRRHHKHREEIEELEDEMQEKIEEEQERFEESVEEIEEKIEELQEKIEEIREELEDRLEEIREQYEEKIEELQEAEEEEKEKEEEGKEEDERSDDPEI